MNKTDIEIIRDLVGDVTPEQIRHIDSFVHTDLGVFIPMSGACEYAVSPEHTHPSYMFVCGFNGDVRMSIANEIINSPAETVQCMSPMTPHQELPSDEIPRYNAIFISPRLFEEQAKHYPNKLLALAGKTIKRPAQLLNRINSFIAEASVSQAGKDAILHAISIEICHLLLRQVFEIDCEHAISQRSEIDNAVEFINTNIDKKLSVQSIAESACMSATHFSRVFKKEMGLTVNDFILEKRLSKAKRMLISENISFTEISETCGFNSLSYFSSVFQKKYRISPSKYLEAMKNGQI